MNFLTEYLCIHQSYQNLFRDLNYQLKSRVFFRDLYLPTNKALYEINKDKVENYQVKNFANDFVDALKICTSKNLMYKDPNTMSLDIFKTCTSNDIVVYRDGVRNNGALLSPPGGDKDEIYWNPNCYINLDNVKVYFSSDHRSNFNTRVGLVFSRDKTFFLDFKRTESSLREHVDNCLDGVRKKINLELKVDGNEYPLI